MGETVALRLGPGEARFRVSSPGAPGARLLGIGLPRGFDPRQGGAQIGVFELHHLQAMRKAAGLAA